MKSRLRYREPKLFLGKFSRTLDTENRFSVPSGFREQLTSGAYLTQGFDRNLQVLTTGAFQRVYHTVMNLNLANPLARLLLRLILGTAHEITINEKGELIIPTELGQFADLRADILVIGQGEYFEIWSPDLWKEQEIKVRDAEVNSSRFSALTVTAQ